jgi:hypothetical protein
MIFFCAQRVFRIKGFFIMLRDDDEVVDDDDDDDDVFPCRARTKRCTQTRLDIEPNLQATVRCITRD